MRPPRWFQVAAVGAIVGAAGTTRAAEEILSTSDTPADCRSAPETRAPDPRCAESLDGRGAPAAVTPERTAGRAALFLPRAIAAGLFWPIVETTEVVESHDLQNWYVAWLTSDDGKIGVRPLLKYSAGFISTVGLRVFYDRLPGEGSGLAASFQTAGPSVLMGELDGAAPRWTGLTFRTVFNRRDDRYFAGIGALSNADLAANGWTPARYGSTNVSGEARWMKRLPASFRVTMHADLQHRDYRADGVSGGPSVATVFRTPSPECEATTVPVGACVDPAILPGFQSGLRLLHEGAGVVWDYRSHTRDGSGAALAVDSTFAEGFAGDPSRHVTLSAEPLVAIGGTDRQLILRGRVALVHALTQAPIPFEELVGMSGLNGMRGYLDGRFRGESGMLATAEYRWYVARRIDASIFTDVGTVAGHNFAGLGQAEWFPSFGAGLRLYDGPAQYWQGSIDSGIQVAYAPGEGVRVIFAVATF